MSEKIQLYKDHTSPLYRACKMVGGAINMAEKIGVTPQAIYQWQQVPAEHCIKIEIACRRVVTRYQLRPDLYPTE